MILGAVSLVDCVVAGLILVPVLLWQAGIWATLSVIFNALPLFAFRVPLHILGRFVRSKKSLSRFAREGTLFEDVVIRIVRYGFEHFPTPALRAFLSREFAYSLLKWRMLRSGYFAFPAHLQQKEIEERKTKTEGLWIKSDPSKSPDVVVYYVHGGGFALGSCYFYLEFLLAMHDLLTKAGYHNPAIFALEYTLAPEAKFPTQVSQAVLGYRHVLDEVRDPCKVCVAGDSAGGNLTLSLLLELGVRAKGSDINGVTSLPVPRLAVLISPWITLLSSMHNPSKVDYLERDTLWQYGMSYSGASHLNDPVASPGLCLDDGLWKSVSPQRGYFIIYGGAETLAPDASQFLRRRRGNGIEVDAMEFEGGIHAWPVASLFLSRTRRRRLQGLESIVNQIRMKCCNEDDSKRMGRQHISD